MRVEGDAPFGRRQRVGLGRGDRLRRSVVRVASRNAQPRRARAVVREAFIQGVIFGFVLAAVVVYTLASALHW
jgi:hypothetical protein